MHLSFDVNSPHNVLFLRSMRPPLRPVAPNFYREFLPPNPGGFGNGEGIVGRGTEPPTLDSPKFNRQVAPHPSYPTRVGANARPVT